MPTITLTVSAAAATELTDAFAVNYQATIQTGVGPGPDFTPIMGPNPETKTQYGRRQIIALLKQHVILYRKRLAAAASVATEPDIT